MNFLPAIRDLGQVEYEPTWRAMQAFTDTRTAETPDEAWVLQHPPVFTLGMNGDPAHLLDAGDIPVVPVDRGGQVTYHGPGQLIVYPLLDLRRLGLGVRDLVVALENAVIEYAARSGIAAAGRRDAPGVYVAGAKLASLGLRIRRGSSYHGLAFNVNMDLAAFRRINPCGFKGLAVTQLADLGGPADIAEVARDFPPVLVAHVGAAAEAAAVRAAAREPAAPRRLRADPDAAARAPRGP